MWPPVRGHLFSMVDMFSREKERKKNGGLDLPLAVAGYPLPGLTGNPLWTQEDCNPICMDP